MNQSVNALQLLVFIPVKTKTISAVIYLKKDGQSSHSCYSFIIFNCCSFNHTSPLVNLKKDGPVRDHLYYFFHSTSHFGRIGLQSG
jgi:hypothetical protein